MSDEDLKVDVNLGDEGKSESGGEAPKWDSIATGFDSPESLAKAHVELMEKSKRKPLSSDEKEFIGQVKEFFGETSSESSKLENADLQTISQALRDQTGVSPRLMDLAVSKTASTLSERKSKANISEAKVFLKDAVNKKAVETGLDNMNDDYKKEFNNRLKSGKVSKSELDVLSALGRDDETADSSFTIGAETQNNNEDALVIELHDLIDNHGHILHNEGHPRFAEYNQRVERLKKQLKIA